MTDFAIDYTQGFPFVPIFSDDTDWITGDPTGQNIALLFATYPGDWKEIPMVGIGVADMQGLSDDRFLDRTIRLQLEADGFKLSNMKINNGKILVDGRY